MSGQEAAEPVCPITVANANYCGKPSELPSAFCAYHESERVRLGGPPALAQNRARWVTPRQSAPRCLAEAAPDRPALPAYVEQIVAVMTNTEGHPDAEVRAARKVVANALTALNKALRNADGPVRLVVEDPRPGPRTPIRTRGAGVQALYQRIEDLGVSAKQIRQWVRNQGHGVPSTGMLPAWAVDAYEKARPPAAGGLVIPQTPTPAGFAAHLGRGPCGHILCANATACLLKPETEESAS